MDTHSLIIQKHLDSLQAGCSKEVRTCRSTYFIICASCKLSKEAISNEQEGAVLDECLLRASNANSAYKTASKHVKFHTKPAAPKAAGKGKAKANPKKKR